MLRYIPATYFSFNNNFRYLHFFKFNHNLTNVHLILFTENKKFVLFKNNNLSNTRKYLISYHLI